MSQIKIHTNELIFDDEDVAADGTLTSDSYNLDDAVNYSIQFDVNDNTGTTQTFHSVLQQVTEITFPAGDATGLLDSYFDFSGALDATGVKWRAWFNVDASGSAPATAGRTLVEIAVNSTDTAVTVAAAASAAIDALTGVSAVAATGVLTITNTDAGASTDASNSGSVPDLEIEVTTDGASDVNATTNVITIESHGYVSGEILGLSSSESLPGGLATGNYFAIKVTDDTLKLASSQANAALGTAIDITDEGTGTFLFTPSTIAGSVHVQGSNDDVTFEDVTSGSTAIAAAANYMFTKEQPAYRYGRVTVAQTGGSINLSARLVIKSEKP